MDNGLVSCFFIGPPCTYNRIGGCSVDKMFYFSRVCSFNNNNNNNNNCITCKAPWRPQRSFYLQITNSLRHVPKIRSSQWASRKQNGQFDTHSNWATGSLSYPIYWLTRFFISVCCYLGVGWLTYRIAHRLLYIFVVHYHLLCQAMQQPTSDATCRLCQLELTGQVAAGEAVSSCGARRRDGTGSPGHGSVCKTRCLTRFWGFNMCVYSGAVSTE